MLNKAQTSERTPALADRVAHSDHPKGNRVPRKPRSFAQKPTRACLALISAHRLDGGEVVFIAIVESDLAFSGVLLNQRHDPRFRTSELPPRSSASSAVRLPPSSHASQGAFKRRQFAVRSVYVPSLPFATTHTHNMACSEFFGPSRNSFEPRPFPPPLCDDRVDDGRAAGSTRVLKKQSPVRASAADTPGTMRPVSTLILSSIEGHLLKRFQTG